MVQIDFNVEKIEPVVMRGPNPLAHRDLMSPYVWKGPQDHEYQMMVRAVPRLGEEGDTGTIWYATSKDGLTFTATDKPAIAPGPEPEDAGGCEDPTVVQLQGGGYVVYYTGVAADRRHGEMLYAAGPSIEQLQKKGVAMASTPSEGNVKEATVDRTKAGGWRMFYEYAAGGASLIGLAIGKDVAGPWEHERQPFAPREGAWDNFHLSTGPLLTNDKDQPVMFYNGATQDARWRIGWIAFDAEYRRVVDRCIEPLIVPPPSPDRMDIDIAFAASIVFGGGHTWLYFSRADRALFRATIRRFKG
ncbi:glycosidase [Pleomorphomonas oryzae]|uniref:glycoside hydrolase family 130 protein n=1 Tax=Pleomorphomonas oryzae TaxID=261934 RepID=UPI0004190FF9|nr:glycosidase [Pleomorphomonas oryzae]